MAYANKKIDHEKRKNQEGSYSLYNHLYHYLLDNYESDHNFTDNDKVVLVREGIAYNQKGGQLIDENEIRSTVDDAIEEFKYNKGEHGDTAQNLGKAQSNSFDTIKRSIADLRW